ncbi:MAG: TaqI-like C-terminal specificity domain-containing protein, partial [Petrotogales bacterium]
LWMIKVESGWTDKNRGCEKPEVFFKKAYPAIYNYFLDIDQQVKNGKLKIKGKGLRNRDDQGRYWWELRDCNYYQEFEKRKIVWPVIGREGTFAYDYQSFYHNDKAFSLVGEELKLLISFLNSRLAYWYLLQIGSKLGSKGFEFRKIYVEQLPVPQIPKGKQKPLIDLVDKILANTKSDDYLENSNKQAKVHEYEKQIDQMVYKLYSLTEEEIRIIEGQYSSVNIFSL